MTNNCITSLDNVFAKPIQLEHIGIDKEDIFFAWLGKFDESNTKMTICTLSYPSYHYLRQALPFGNAKVDAFVKEQAEANNLPTNSQIARALLAEATTDSRLTKDYMEALKNFGEKELLNKNEFHQHMSSNEIIVSNWEFVQEDGDWKIDNIAMRKLKECIMKPFYIRWQFRIKYALATNTDFTKRVLRYDYAGDYLIILLLLNYAIFSSITYPT